MKIIFFARLFWPHIGGVEKHVLKLSEELIKRGNKVTVVTTKYDGNLKDKEAIDGINIIRFDQPNTKYIGLLHTWYWMITHINLIKESDILHFHDVFIWYWPIKILLPLKKVYITFHGQWGKYPLSRIDIFQKKIGSALSFGNISIGEYIPKNYGFKSDKILYGAAVTSQIAKKKKDNRNVLYVGRLDEELPIKKYFEVFKRISKYNIDIIGDGSLKKEAKIYGKVHGFTDPGAYYKRAKYVFASGYLTIMESLANKCLVFVAYGNRLQKDYYELTPFNKFIICNNDPDKLFEKFEYYCKYRGEADELIEKGYEWVKSQTWAKAADMYLKLWTE